MPEKPIITVNKIHNEIDELGKLLSRVQHPHKKLFLEQYIRHNEITKACEAVGVNRNSVYFWCKQDEEFAEIYAEVKNIANEYHVELFERELNGRALDRSAPMSSVLLMFKLKAERPDKYRERVDQRQFNVLGNIVFDSNIPEAIQPQASVELISPEIIELEEGNSEPIHE